MPKTTTLVMLSTLPLIAALNGCARTEAPSGEREPDAEGRTAAEARDHGADDVPERGHTEASHSGIELEHALGELGVVLGTAAGGGLEITVELPGQVRVNGDRMAHVAPRVDGVVTEVSASLGDRVRGGQVLAVLESRQLADLTADYLAAISRLELAEAGHRREERLWEQRVSSEEDYLDARNARAEARIGLRSAEQKLIALGFSDEEIAGLPERRDAELTRHALRAPFSGEVIQRHLTQGESVSADTVAFTVADLSTVWIDLDVYQKELGVVEGGQTVVIETDHGDLDEGRIRFVQPLVGEETRTALARILMPNPDGVWHPGCFVSGRVHAASIPVQVAVPRDAVVKLADGDSVVFVAHGDELVPRTVERGRSGAGRVEIVAGLEPGERYATEGAFALKAELGKASFGHGHAH